MFTMMKEFNSPKDNFLTSADSITNLINALDKDDLYRNYDEITKENADIVYAFEKV